MHDDRCGHQQSFGLKHLRFAARGYFVFTLIGSDRCWLHALLKAERIARLIYKLQLYSHISPSFNTSFAVVVTISDATAFPSAVFARSWIFTGPAPNSRESA